MVFATVAAPLVGSVLGSIFGSSDSSRADEYIEKMAAALEERGYPPDTSKALALQSYKQATLQNPEQMTTAYEQIGQQPEYQDQRDVLAEYKNQIRSGGLSAEDRANLDQALSEQARATQSQQASINQRMQQQGMAGSGASLALQGQAAQEAANRAAQSAVNVGALSAQARRQALQNYAGQANAMRQQGYNEQANLAQARDVNQQFNIRNKMNTAQWNAGLAAKDVEAGNAELRRQQEAKRQYWADLGTRAHDYGQIGSYYKGNANNTYDKWANIGSSVGQGLGTIYGYQKNKQDTNKDPSKG